MIWIDVKRDSYRPLRGLHPFLFFDPGACAPGFMLPSASRTAADERWVKSVIEDCLAQESIEVLAGWRTNPEPLLRSG
jgi:hypothetical protein